MMKSACGQNALYRAVNLVFPYPEFQNWPLITRILPHALICAGLIDEWDFEFEDAARLLNQAGIYQYHRAEYGEAEKLYKLGLAICEKTLGFEHPYVAVSLNNLAQLVQATNRLAEAEPLMRRHLEIFLRFTHDTGHPHPNLQAAINNYASLLQAMGNGDENIQSMIGELGRRFDVDISGQMDAEPSPKLRAVIEQLMSDPSKAQEIFEKHQKEDPALLKELLELIERQQQK